MPDPLSQKKLDFVKYYIKDWLSFDWDFDYIIDLSKYLLNVLRFNNTEIDKVVDIITQQLQEILNDNKTNQQRINWFSIYKNSDGTTKYVDFFVEDNKVYNIYKNIPDFL